MLMKTSTRDSKTIILSYTIRQNEKNICGLKHLSTPKITTSIPPTFR